MNAPLIVQQLAATVQGVPLAWREYDDKWVIIMEDGRKLTFKKAEIGTPRAQDTVQDYKAGVEETPQDKHRRKPKEL